MRTTLNIDDDVLRVAQSLARSQGTTTGKVISDLARKGLRPPPVKTRSGFPMFDVAPDAPGITPEMVRQALEES